MYDIIHTFQKGNSIQSGSVAPHFHSIHIKKLHSKLLEQGVKRHAIQELQDTCVRLCERHGDTVQIPNFYRLHFKHNTSSAVSRNLIPEKSSAVG
jgi:hypothetical protein